MSRKRDSTGMPGPIDLNRRFLQAISYFIEWAKHIITIASAIMVLSATFLRDVVKSTDPVVRLLIVLFLVGSYICLLASVWKSLQFISFASSTMLTKNEIIGSGDELDRLQRLLRLAQRLFLFGVTCFSVLALLSLLSWIFGYSQVSSMQ